MARAAVQVLVTTTLFCLIVCAGGRPWPAQAQARQAATTPASYVHDVWQTDDGLPHNAVNAILQTRDGYLWLGTAAGLVRFDGVGFAAPPGRSAPLLENSYIWALHEDHAGAVWIGSGNGLFRYQDGEVTTYTTEPNAAETEAGLSNDFVRAIYEDRAGALWIGTYGGGLNRLQDGAWTHYAARDGLASDFVKALYEDHAGTLWIGTEAGLSRLRDGQLTTYTTADGLLQDDIRSICEDHTGTLWIGTGRGLSRYDGERFTPAAPSGVLAMGAIRHVFEDRAGALWIGLEADGLARLDNDQLKTFTAAAATLSHNDVRTIYEDREGSLWIGTNGGGLNRLKQSHVAVYGVAEGLAGQVAFTVYEDRAGTIWIGTSEGLARLQNGRFTTYTTDDGLPNNVVFALCEDREGNLWIGTNGGGLARLRDGQFTTYTTGDGLPNDVVFALYEDRKGTLWIGTNDGLSRYAGGTFTTYAPADGIAAGLVVTLLEDHMGSLWIGTDRGLSKLENGVFQTFTTADGLASDLIRDLYEDREGTLWIATRGGLSRFAQGRFTSYTTQEGLFDNVVYQILEDGTNHLWLSGNKGLSRLRKSELAALDQGAIATLTPTSYGKGDGMRSSEFNGGNQPAGWKARDGRLWFPTLAGVVVVDPASLRTNHEPPPVQIEALVVDDVPTPLAEDLRLGPGKERFAFHYTALSFLDPGKVQFKYRLEGLDAAWIDAGTSRTAYYTHLPPGTYTFRVIASNNDGVWNETGAALDFTLQPYFYQTYWFLAFCLLLAGMVGAGLYGLRVRHMKAREAALLSLVEARTQSLVDEKQKTEALAHTLEIQAAQLLELDHQKSRFFANLSHEFRTPLTLIIAPLEDALSGRHGTLPQEARHQLSVVLGNARRLLRLISQLLALSKLEAGRMDLKPVRGDVVPFVRDVVLSFSALAESRQISLLFSSGEAPCLAAFDPDKLEKVLYNLLSNAIKFTAPGGKVQVAAGATASAGVSPGPENPGDDLIEISVRDTGCGIPSDELPYIFDRFRQGTSTVTDHQEGTGIGLALAKELVALHGGRLTAESQLGFGSTFTVYLPVGDLEAAGSDGLATDGRLPLPAPSPLPEADAVVPLPPAPPAEVEASTPAATILVAEDNPHLRAYLRTHLTPAYRLVEAADGREGLEKAREVRPDLIVADVMMPHLDGYALCRALKEDEQTRSIPIILLTARASEESKLEGLEVGADDYLYKPFSMPELEAKIRNFIAVRRELLHRYSRTILVEPAGIAVPSSEEAFLEKAIATVEDHLSDAAFTVERLADELGLSPRQLQRRLRTVTGQSPAGFIRHLRLQRAAQLLAQQAGTVAEIAYAVGFNKPSYFSAVFRKTFGQSPSEYTGDA